MDLKEGDREQSLDDMNITYFIFCVYILLFNIKILDSLCAQAHKSLSQIYIVFYFIHLF